MQAWVSQCKSEFIFNSIYFHLGWIESGNHELYCRALSFVYFCLGEFAKVVINTITHRFDNSIQIDDIDIVIERSSRKIIISFCFCCCNCIKFHFDTHFDCTQTNVNIYMNKCIFSDWFAYLYPCISRLSNTQTSTLNFTVCFFSCYQTFISLILSSHFQFLFIHFEAEAFVMEITLYNINLFTQKYVDKKVK